MKKLSLFIATCVDGYIAKPNDDLSFLKLVEKEGEDYGYAEFTDTIDTIKINNQGPFSLLLCNFFFNFDTNGIEQ